MNIEPSLFDTEFVPWDIEIARINFGANCGPAAFAAVTGSEVCRVMRYFRHFEHSKWTNLTQMRRAFTDAGYEVAVLKRQFPQRGIALIQWLGPWTRKHFFSRWSLIYTHWVAVQGKRLFDHTVAAWQPIQQWRKEVAPDFVSQIPKARGWEIKYGVEVHKSQLSCLGSCSAGTHSPTSAANIAGYRRKLTSIR